MLCFSDFASKEFLLGFKVSNILDFDLQFITELVGLHNCRFEPLVGFLHILLTLHDHLLPLGAVGKAEALPEADLGHLVELLVTDSRIDGLNHTIVDLMSL